MDVSIFFFFFFFFFFFNFVFILARNLSAKLSRSFTLCFEKKMMNTTGNDKYRPYAIYEPLKKTFELHGNTVTVQNYNVVLLLHHENTPM